MSLLDILLFISIFSIWTILAVNVVLIFAGYMNYLTMKVHDKLPADAPFVTIMVPAHNEGIVIVRRVKSLLALDYPQDKYEIIVINDNSSDNSAELLAQVQSKYPNRNLKIINTDNITGGKGKSNALNIGLKEAKGSIIAVYDADNTPEKQALRILVAELLADDKAGAVIGKFRTRNKNASLLTRFINIETLSFQWMAQAGRKNYLIYVQYQELILLFVVVYWRKLVVGT